MAFFPNLPKNQWQIPWRLVLIFVLLSAGILVLGYQYYAHQEAHFRRGIEAQLNTIANIKVKQITAWRQERMHDALLIFDDPIFATEVQEWFDGKSPPRQKVEILHRMQGLKQNMYTSIRLLDAQGRLRLAIPEDARDITPLIRRMCVEALAKEKVIFSDLHRNSKKQIRLDLVVPIHFHQDDHTVFVGNIILCVNPQHLLYPIIQSWPVPSKTGEIVMVRRENADVVFLNELRHRQGTILNLRLPLTATKVPAIMAVQGHEGIVHGVDYRGIPVLAATRVIPGSPWFLVAKLDTSEVYAPIRERFQQVSLLLIALIALAGLGIAYLWRSRDVQFYRQQYSLSQRYEYLTKYANDIILIMDGAGRIVEVNDRTVAAYGYSRDDLLHLSFGDLFPEKLSIIGAKMLEMAGKDGHIVESIHRRQDGTTFPVEVGLSLMEIDGERLFQGIIRDITERKKRENALQKSEQELRFLSSQLLMVQEAERQRISLELHDELGQALMVLKFQLDRLSREKRKTKAEFQFLLQYLDEVIESIRRISRDLSPSSLEHFGLAQALKNLFESFGRHLRMRWSPTEIDAVDQSFSRLAQINIYRIFQEALTNIARHAQASQITVKVEQEEGRVLFTVEDDGLGFELGKVMHRENGIGLAALQERARLAGGFLKINSRPGAGTQITFNIPMSKEEGNETSISNSAG